MGLLDFLERKINNVASENADTHLHNLGFNMAQLSEDIQIIAHREMCDAMIMMGEARGKALTVAECAMLKLASVYVSRKGDATIQRAATIVLPNLGGGAGGKVHQDVALLVRRLMNDVHEVPKW